MLTDAVVGDAERSITGVITVDLLLHIIVAEADTLDHDLVNTAHVSTWIHSNLLFVCIKDKTEIENFRFLGGRY